MFNPKDLVTITIANTSIPATVISRSTAFADEPTDAYLVQVCNDVTIDDVSFVGVHYVQVPAEKLSRRTKQ